MEELRELSEELDCEYEVKDSNVVIKFESFKDKFELICKHKDFCTTVIKTKNGKLMERTRFFSYNKMKSYICCQFALECFQLA